MNIEPCPKHGCHLVWDADPDGGVVVWCIVCSARPEEDAPRGDTLQAAVAAWNRRIEKEAAK